MNQYRTSEPWYSAPGVSGTEYVPLKNVMGISDVSGYLPGVGQCQTPLGYCN